MASEGKNSTLELEEEKELYSIFKGRLAFWKLAGQFNPDPEIWKKIMDAETFDDYSSQKDNSERNL